jgi:hypothetical protein
VFHDPQTRRTAHPRRRYVVGKDSWMLTALPKNLSAALLDRLRMKLFGMPARFGIIAQE